MAQIGYGYGSEWQLLRMLGHHRDYFYEQLVDRLSAAIFLNKHKIKTQIVNIFFENGYEIKVKDPKSNKLITINTLSKSRIEWQKKIESEVYNLKLNDKALSIISNVFIDCKPNLKRSLRII